MIEFHAVSKTYGDFTAVRALALKEVTALRPRLLPEITVFSMQNGDGRTVYVGGVADALAMNERGEIEVTRVCRGDYRLSQPHRLGQNQAESLRAMKRNDAVAASDKSGDIFVPEGALDQTRVIPRCFPPQLAQSVVG